MPLSFEDRDCAARAIKLSVNADAHGLAPFVVAYVLDGFRGAADTRVVDEDIQAFRRDLCHQRIHLIGIGDITHEFERRSADWPMQPDPHRR